MNTAIMCMAIALYFEARSEPVVAQYRVAEVIVNRVESPKYPDNVCAVVKQDLGPKDHDCQFSFYCDGKDEVIANVDAFEEVLDVTLDVLSDDYTPALPTGTMWYHTQASKPSWASRLKRVGAVGAHYFYKAKSSN